MGDVCQRVGMCRRNWDPDKEVDVLPVGRGSVTTSVRVVCVRDRGRSGRGRPIGVGVCIELQEWSNVGPNRWSTTDDRTSPTGRNCPKSWWNSGYWWTLPFLVISKRVLTIPDA